MRPEHSSSLTTTTEGNLDTVHISQPILEAGTEGHIVGEVSPSCISFRKTHTRYRYCAVFANEKAWNNARKIWVPEYNEKNKRIWFNTEKFIRKTITELHRENASWKRQYGFQRLQAQYLGKLQVMIPTKILGNSPPQSRAFGLDTLSV